MELDRDEQRPVLSLKREKAAPARSGAPRAAQPWESKAVIAYATPPPAEEEEGWTDLEWLGWPTAERGGPGFNGSGDPFPYTLFVTETRPASQSLQARVCVVPEPSTPVMLFVGSVSLVAFQWMRRRAR